MLFSTLQPLRSVNGKPFLSRCVLRFKLSLKFCLTKLFILFFRSRSYGFFGIPSGLADVGDKLEIFYPEMRLKVNRPHSLAPQSTFSSFPEEDMLPADGILTLKNGTALGIGANLLENCRLITNFLQPVKGRPPEKHELFRFSSKKFFPNILHVQRPVVTLSAGWQGEFYHWIHEVLPRFHLVEKKGLSSCLFFIESSKAFQRESLELLGILKENLISTDDYEAVKSPLLFVPSISHPSFWSCQYLRQKFIPKFNKRKKKKIYISREDAEKRRLVNEKEVFALLEKRGFEKVALSSMPLLEQMELFYNASAIIGPHGAGFSHIVFCDPGTPFLEFFSPTYVPAYYWRICNRASLPYYCLIGKESFPVDMKHHPLDHDIEIDLNKLKAILKQMGDAV